MIFFTEVSNKTLLEVSSLEGLEVTRTFSQRPGHSTEPPRGRKRLGIRQGKSHPENPSRSARNPSPGANSQGQPLLAL